ncbi:hypothetical protein Tco_0590563 [Tanacetum coccineum]
MSTLTLDGLVEKETKLAVEFDKFTLEKGETIQSYYLRFAKPINDIINNGIEMTNLYINTKFLNHLQPEWKRYVTTVKQSKDFHTITYDQLFAYLKQNQDVANAIRTERATRTHDPLAIGRSQVRVLSRAIGVSSRVRKGKGAIAFWAGPNLVVWARYAFWARGHVATIAVKKMLHNNSMLHDNPILSNAVLFLSKAFTTRYPPTNNQLKILSNLQTQANIHNGRVTVQSVPTRLTQSCASNNRKAKATVTYVIKNVGDYARANVIDQSSSKEAGRTLRKRLQTMADLNVDEKKQVKCDIKATNIT